MVGGKTEAFPGWVISFDGLAVCLWDFWGLLGYF